MSEYAALKKDIRFYGGEYKPVIIEQFINCADRTIEMLNNDISRLNARIQELENELLMYRYGK